ncbi:MAG TPA: tetratricopeptide repeat protein, partial [Pyrinomonadaceae bacterium]|nr:tetratricopeptide repeat protein [Pyrinomonadaceae bacterium]
MRRLASLKLTLLLVAVLMCAAPTRQIAGQEPAKQLPALADGSHAIKGGESHSYLINLVAGQFLHALIEQQGVDLTVSLFRPDGSLIGVSDSPNEQFGPEPALLVADVSGAYRIEVQAPNSRAAAANYQIKIAALREASETDKQHVAAQRAFDEAQKLRRQPDATAKRASIVKYQESIPWFQAAGDIYRQTLAVHASGISYFQLNEPRNALRCFEEALALAQKVGAQRLEPPIETFLGGSFETLGEVAKSHAHFERARVLAGRLGDKPTQGSAVTSIGKLYLEAGDFQRSLDYSLQALPLFTDFPPRRAIVLNNIGAAYVGLGEPERALDYLQQSLEIMKRGADRAAEAQTLHNVGWAYSRLGKYREAQDYYNQALAMVQKIGNRFLEAQSLDLVGASYSDMGHPQKALDLHQQALEIQRTAKNVRREMLSYGNLAHVFNLLGRPEEALDQYNQALAISRRIGDLNSATKYLEGRARAEQKLGNLAEARKDIEESLSLIETVRARSESQSLRASYLASKEKAYELYVDLLMQLHAKDPSARHDAEALQASERGRARSLLEMLNEAPADIEQGVGVDLVKREREIRQAINAKAQRQIQLTAQNGSRQEIETFGKEIRALEDEY